MFKILITDTDNHTVIVDDESNSVLLSYYRASDQGVAARAMNHAHPEIVGQVSLGVLELIHTIDQENPMVAFCKALTQKRSMEKKVVKQDG